jgi:hypothetical protein
VKIVAALDGRGCDRCGRIALFLDQRGGDADLPRANLFEQRGAMVAAALHQRGREDAVADIGFGHQVTAETLHDRHDLDRAAAQPTIGLGDRQHQPTEFGHLRPAARIAVGAFGEPLQPVGRTPFIFTKTLGAVAQHLLLVAVGELHR